MAKIHDAVDDANDFIGITVTFPIVGALMKPIVTMSEFVEKGTDQAKNCRKVINFLWLDKFKTTCKAADAWLGDVNQKMSEVLAVLENANQLWCTCKGKTTKFSATVAAGVPRLPPA